MDICLYSLSHRIKIDCLAKGVRITPRAFDAITKGGEQPISIFEYPTTAGVTLKLEGGVFVNAPFHGIYRDTAQTILDYESDSEQFYVQYRKDKKKANVLPLPGYLKTLDSEGEPIKNRVMSHVDRARISPIQGCSYRCHFCDCNLKEYILYSPERLIEALDVAISDKVLPVTHVLISGGTPKTGDRKSLDSIYEKILTWCPLPVDVMLVPRPKSEEIVDRLFNWGINGFAFNLEIYDGDIASRLSPEKNKVGRRDYQYHIERALELTGGKGRIRSLLLVGLESIDSTLKGVEWLSRMGCDPVLSPFRPAPGTPLEKHPIPTAEDLFFIWNEASEIVDKYGVQLGPRCTMCQHNALAFPYSHST